MFYTLPKNATDGQVLTLVRSFLLIVIAVGLFATAVELLLLGHIKPVLQAFPVLLIFLGLAMLLWHVVSGNARSLRIFQGTMFLCVLSGFLGGLIHFVFDVAWLSQKYPELRGVDLFRAAMSGLAPPMAPGMLVQLALLGLLYAFRHPALDVGITDDSLSIARR